MVRQPDATMQPAPQDNHLMSKRRVLGLKPQLRLEWRGQDGQNEKEQPDHSASLGDSITSSTQIRFSVHTGVEKLEEVDELSAAVAVSDERMDLAGKQVDSGQQANRAMAFVLVIPCKGRVDAGFGRQIRRRGFEGLVGND